MLDSAYMDHAHALKRFSPIAGISFRSVPHLCVKGARVCVRVITCLFVCHVRQAQLGRKCRLCNGRCALCNVHAIIRMS
jgi:hypothetical protein